MVLCSEVGFFPSLFFFFPLKQLGHWLRHDDIAGKKDDKQGKKERNFKRIVKMKCLCREKGKKNKYRWGGDYAEARSEGGTTGGFG